MIQQGQVFKLKARGADGKPLWAYRYRLEGRGSARPQVGGFVSRAEARKALQNRLARLGPGARAATMTLGESVDEYLDMHQARAGHGREAPLAAREGDRRPSARCRLAELSPKDVYAWRLTIPEGHRFEATQALRQVLNRAVAWELLDDQPGQAGRAESAPPLPRRSGRSNPGQQIDAVAERLGPRLRADGRVRGRDRASTLGAVRARTTRHRSCRRCRLRPTGVRERTAQAHQDAAEQRALFRCRRSRSRRSTGYRRSDNPLLFPNARGGHLDFRNFGRRHWKPAQTHCRDRAAARPLRPAPHLRHLRAPRRRPGVRPLTLHGHEHRDDRPPLRPPRPRQPRARRLAPRRARARTGRGRWVDAAPAGPQDRTAPAIPALAGGDPGGPWTLGGRRGPKPSPSANRRS